MTTNFDLFYEAGVNQESVRSVAQQCMLAHILSDENQRSCFALWCMIVNRQMWKDWAGVICLLNGPISFEVLDNSGDCSQSSQGRLLAVWPTLVQLAFLHQFFKTIVYFSPGDSINLNYCS